MQVLPSSCFSPVGLLALPPALSLWFVASRCQSYDGRVICPPRRSCALFASYRLFFYAQTVFQIEAAWVLSPYVPTTIVASTTLCTLGAICAFQQVGVMRREHGVQRE